MDRGTTRPLVLTSLLAFVVSATVHWMGLGVVTLPPKELVIALETAIALTVLLATYLMLSRYRLDRNPVDGMLAIALSALAASAVVAWLQVMLGPPTGAGELATLRLLAALIFAATVLLPTRWRSRLSPHIRTIAVAVAVVLAGLVGRVVWQAARDAAPAAPGGWLLLLAEAAGSVAFLVVAIRIIRSVQPARDPFWHALAYVALGLSLSRLNYLFQPGMAAGQLAVGDLFRVGGFAVLFFGVLGETRRAWEQHATGPLLAERRRIARELHDGLAHEVAYLAGAARTLAGRDGSRELRQIADTADRLLDETRQVIHTSTRPMDEPLDRLLVAYAEELSHRAGARVRADCQPDVHTLPEVGQALTRIVRESVTNAVRHGQADLIELRLHTDDGRLNLTITDNGRGFDQQGRQLDGSNTGFGLTSMRERAEALGGTFDVRSAPGRGVCVEVVL